MNWNCTNTEERLSDYLDGLLTPAETDAFKAHAASCEDCASMVAQVSSLVTRMHALELEPAPPMLFDHILDATSGPRKEKKNWKSWFGWTGSFVQPRFVMGLITVAAMILILVYASGFTPSKLKKTDLSPVSAFRAANRQVHLTYARSVKYVNDLRVVYEIQSRLQPSNEPSPETSPMPEEQQPKSSNPQEKSQTTPKPGHSQARTVAMLATYVNHGWAATCNASMRLAAFSTSMNATNRSAR
ncbi:MAG: anti-sigma factor [Candidatus Acidiferrales bacterium]